MGVPRVCIGTPYFKGMPSNELGPIAICSRCLGAIALLVVTDFLKKVRSMKI